MSIESAPLDTDGFEEDGDEDFGGHVTAALGNTWSHAVNTRLIVQYLDDNYRQVRQLPQKYKLTECCEPYLDCLGILLISCVLEGGGGVKVPKTINPSALVASISKLLCQLSRVK